MPDAGSVRSGIHAVCRSISFLSLSVIVEEEKKLMGRRKTPWDVGETINTFLHHHWTSLELPPSKPVTTVPGLYNREIQMA